MDTTVDSYAAGDRFVRPEPVAGSEQAIDATGQPRRKRFHTESIRAAEGRGEDRV